MAPEVVEAMLPFLKTAYGNPSSLHRFGRKTAEAVGDARERVAELVGAFSDEIVFTSCATESSNTAILGTLAANPTKTHIVTSSVEHPSILNICRVLETRGYRITYVSVNADGMLDLEELASSITDDTALVTIMYANNETGVMFPVEEIGKVVRSRGVVFHCDAVQAVGKIPVNVDEIAVDLMSISGHKFHAPKGIGALFVRRGTPLVPHVTGGPQERGRRGGTENVAGIVGLGSACSLAHNGLAERYSAVATLRDRFEFEVHKAVAQIMINGISSPRLPNTSNISFEAVEGEAVLFLLDEDGIAVSTGSACSSGEVEPSHVLRAMGVPPSYIQGTIRFSLSRYTTDEEISYVCERLPAVINKLRAISPCWSEVHALAG